MDPGPSTRGVCAEAMIVRRRIILGMTTPDDEMHPFAHDAVGDQADAGFSLPCASCFDHDPLQTAVVKKRQTSLEQIVQKQRRSALFGC